MSWKGRPAGLTPAGRRSFLVGVESVAECPTGPTESWRPGNAAFTFRLCPSGPAGLGGRHWTALDLDVTWDAKHAERPPRRGQVLSCLVHAAVGVTDAREDEASARHLEPRVGRGRSQDHARAASATLIPSRAARSPASWKPTTRSGTGRTVIFVEDLAPGGVVHADGDHKIHVLNVHGNRLERDSAFDLDFNRDIGTGPARPHGVALVPAKADTK